MTNHKTYTRQFKEEAVRLLLSSGKTMKQIASELGVSTVSLLAWKKEALHNGQRPVSENPDGIRIEYSFLQEENLRLRQELEIAQTEREILKKSLGIFSRDPLKKGMP